MNELIGEAAEADQEFWNQDAWKELEEDDDILSDEYDSDEKRDIEDSDFSDVDEDQEERERVQQALDHEEQQKRDQRRARAKRRKGIYVDPALKAASAPTKAKTASRDTLSAARKKRPRAETDRSRNVAVPRRRSGREATKQQSKATDNLSKQRIERAQAAPKRVREPLVRLTQQELLEEAARTEIENKRSLELMLILQEEKKREKQSAEKQASKRIIYHSSARNVKVGADHRPVPPPVSRLTFTYVDRIPSVINASPKPKPDRPICSVTGLPAKYRDPVTGIPFRTVEAFKLLRGEAKKSSSS